MNILTFQQGAWSNINAALWTALEQEWPEAQFNQLDYQTDFYDKSPFLRARLLFQALLQYRQRLLPKLLSEPRAFRYDCMDCAHLTKQAFRQSNQLICEKVHSMQKHFSPDIILQTGSRYSAHVPGIPHFIYTDHTHLTNLQYDYFDESDLNLSSWIDEERDLYQKATAVFTMSDHVRRSLIDDYQVAPEKCLTVGAGSNTSPDESRIASTSPSAKQILFVGKQWERKGGPMLVAAFEKVCIQHPDARLVIIGCEPKINHPNIEVKGYLQPAEVQEYFYTSDVFCMPTRQEPFGIVFVEAMAFALPIVAFNLGALPDLVEEGQTGLLVDQGDIGGLSTALCQLLEAPDMSRKFGELGRKKAAAHFQWDLVAKTIRREIESRL